MDSLSIQWRGKGMVVFEHSVQCLALRWAEHGVGDLWGAEERRAWGRRAYPRAS